MRLLNKIIYPAVLGLAALSISCADISFSDPGGYVYSVENGTGGYLKSVTVDQWVCSNVAPGESCAAVLYDQPTHVTVSYEAEKVFGQGEDDTEKLFCRGNGTADDDSFNMEMPADTTECFDTITLRDNYFALWISNASSQAVGRVGYAMEHLDDPDELNTDSLTDYRTVSGEELERTGDTVSDTLEYGYMSELKIYAAVEAQDERFAVSVEGELLNIMMDHDDSLDNSNILKESVEILSDGSVIAYDDGEGNLRFSSNNTVIGTIRYYDGLLTVNTSLPGTMTCNYRYNETVDRQIVPGFKPGTLVIMAGDTIIGRDVDGKIVGDYVCGKMSINYETGYVSFSIEPYSVMAGEPLTCSYAYEIGADNGLGVVSGSDIYGTGSIVYESGKIDFTLSDGLSADAAIICDYHRPIADTGTGRQWLGFHKRQGGNVITGIYALVMSSENVITNHWAITDLDAIMQIDSNGSYYIEYACTDGSMITP